jgi:hypothetical protein
MLLYTWTNISISNWTFNILLSSKLKVAMLNTFCSNNMIFPHHLQSQINAPYFCMKSVTRVNHLNVTFDSPPISITKQTFIPHYEVTPLACTTTIEIDPSLNWVIPSNEDRLLLLRVVEKMMKGKLIYFFRTFLNHVNQIIRPLKIFLKNCLVSPLSNELTHMKVRKTQEEGWIVLAFSSSKTKFKVQNLIEFRVWNNV